VLATARDEGRILLTFDRDVGELIYVQRVPAPTGIILLRPAPLLPDEPLSGSSACCSVPRRTFL